MNEKYPLALPDGTTLAGQYIIEKTLGQGGFGITYKATDYKTGGKVAVKEFFPDSMATRQGTTVMPFNGERGDSFIYGKECFLQEAETLAQFIGIEGIVKIHTYFEENGTAYFVMDYVEGVSFDEYIKDNGGRVTYEVAESVLIKVIEALVVVHSKGIVHRDVTPDNIYITNDGVVKLLDFGAARYSLGDKSRSLDVVLKHGFAPKEQYTRHGRQGPFTDIYTVGASFYFAITGKRPPDSIDRIEEDDLVPPSSLGVAISREKEEAILTAMNVQPGDRFKSMEEFKNALIYGSQQVMVASANAYEQQALYHQPNPQNYNQHNQQYSTGMYGAQDISAYQATTYVGQQPKRKKWLIPVIAGVTVLGIVGGVVLLGGGKSSNKSTTETVDEKIDYTSENYDFDEPKTTEYSEPIITTESVVEDTDTSTETEEYITVEGNFDTYNVNNQMNEGFITSDNNYIVYSTVNKLVSYSLDNDKFITLDSDSTFFGLNSVNDNQIIFIDNGEVYVAQKNGSGIEKLNCTSSYSNIDTLFSNNYGTFFTYKDDNGTVLDYINWSGGVPAYYYNVYSPYTISIIGEYIYYVKQDGSKVVSMHLSEYGTKDETTVVCQLDGYTPERMVGEGNYLYMYSGTEIKRIDVTNGEKISCKTVLGVENNEVITGINVYNGVLYYTLVDYDTNSSSLWSIKTSDSGWKNEDYTCLWDATTSGYMVYEPSICDSYYLWVPIYNISSGKWEAAMVDNETGEVTYFN